MRRCLVFALAGFTLLGLLHAAHLGFYWHSLGRRFTIADVFLREVAPLVIFALCVPAVTRWGERFPLEWPPRARAVLAHLSGIAGTIAFLAAVRTVIERALHVTAPSMPLLHLRDNLVYLSADGFIVYGATVGLAYAAAYTARTRQLLELQAELSKAQLSALRMQLNLQPLVENALRHGLSRRARAGSLTIRASVANGHLEMSVIDDGVGLPSDFHSAPRRGIGIANVRARLQHRYGEAAQLSLVPGAEGGVSARIVLPLRAGAGA